MQESEKQGFGGSECPGAGEMPWEGRRDTGEAS